MSTYLLAFAIGEFGFEETVTKTGIPVRAFATRPHVSARPPYKKYFKNIILLYRPRTQNMQHP